MKMYKCRISSLIRVKLQAFFYHLLLSLLLAGLAAGLVFGLWYPYPFREISGGRELFMLVVVVDVVLGPLITFATFNPAKSLREKRMDFGVIGLLQLGALFYGLWSVAQARPVHVAFEYDRFRVVHAADINMQSLDKAPESLRSLPWTGPTYISLRAMRVEEEVEMTLAALNGVSLSARPELWQPYADSTRNVLNRAQSIAWLKERFPAQRGVIDRSVAATGRQAEKLRYIPLLSREIAWTVLVDGESAEPLGYIALDSF